MVVAGGGTSLALVKVGSPTEPVSVPADEDEMTGGGGNVSVGSVVKDAVSVLFEPSVGNGTLVVVGRPVKVGSTAPPSVEEDEPLGSDSDGEVENDDKVNVVDEQGQTVKVSYSVAVTTLTQDSSCASARAAKPNM